MPRSRRLIKFSQPGTHTPISSIQNKPALPGPTASLRPLSHGAPRPTAMAGSPAWASRQWASCADFSVCWVCSARPLRWSLLSRWLAACAWLWCLWMAGTAYPLHCQVLSSLGLLRLLLCEHDGGRLLVSMCSTVSVQCVPKRQQCAQV